MHIMNARKNTNKYQNRIMPTVISSYAPFCQLVSQTPYFLLLVSIIKRIKVIFKTYKFKKGR